MISSILEIFNIFTIAIITLVAIYFFWQLRFLLIGVFSKFVEPKETHKAKYCFVVCAKNEQDVIRRAITSIKAQNYPTSLIQILVVADNCTDNTVNAVKEIGINNIILKEDKTIGKGHALDVAFKFLMGSTIHSSKIKYPDKSIEYDAVVVLDADSFIDKDFLLHMNNSFTNDQQVIAPFRNTKNFGASITSACNALWFLRDAVLNNKGHFASKNQCTVSGTGFVIGKQIIASLGGFPFYSLIEDFEFSIYAVFNSLKICYNHNAKVYDCGTSSMNNFNKQHTRWLGGFVTVILKYIPKVFIKIFQKGTCKYCIDYFLRIHVIFLLILLEIALLLFSAVTSIMVMDCGAIIWLQELFIVIISICLVVAIQYIFAGIAVVANSKEIDASTLNKVIAFLCYPFAQLINIPLFIKSIFTKKQWAHIDRTK